MRNNRLGYAAVLVCTGVFYICYNDYLSQYVFFLALGLPVFSLLLSLPAMLSARLSIFFGEEDDGSSAARSAGMRKGMSLPLCVRAFSRLPLPGGRSLARLRVRNSLTGEETEETFSFTVGPAPQVFRHALSSPRCGLVTCRIVRARTFDMLGLFSLPLRIEGDSSCAAFFYPAVYHPSLTVRELAIPDGEGERYSQKRPGDDPTELFALREYRQGDRLSRIHWKLSQKTGQTLVKELSRPISDHLLFLLDLNGSGSQADLLLDAFATLSTFLTEQDAAHRVGFRDGESGEFRLLEISRPDDARPVLEAVLADGGQTPLGALFREQLPRGCAHLLCLCCRADLLFLRSLRDLYPSAKLTLLCPVETSAVSRTAFSAAETVGGSFIALTQNHVEEALNGLLL